MKYFNLLIPALVAFVLSISFLTFSCSQEEENDNPSNEQAQIDQEEERERERERSRDDNDCIRSIGELQRNGEVLLTYPYRRISAHFREELGLPIDTVKIHYNRGSRRHWLIGIGSNIEGTRELLAVELALQQGKSFVLSGHTNGGDFYNITHHCASRSCTNCDFDLEADDINGCACNDRRSRGDCNHTISRSHPRMDGIVKRIYDDVCGSRK